MRSPNKLKKYIVVTPRGKPWAPDSPVYLFAKSRRDADLLLALHWSGFGFQHRGGKEMRGILHGTKLCAVIEGQYMGALTEHES